LGWSQYFGRKKSRPDRLQSKGGKKRKKKKIVSLDKKGRIGA